MHTDIRIEKLTKYRYLDSLDSARFRESKNFLDENLLHAYGDIFIALLQGEGIVVTENQLMDSQGFIKVASKLIEAASETKRFDLLNLAVALYDENSTFNATANKFGKIGTDGLKHEDRFVLSAWPKLDEDYTRRLLWADKFRAKERIPDHSECIKHPEEYELAQMLYTVLDYFDSNHGIYRKRSAGQATPIRIRELQQIATIPSSTKPWLFDGLNPKDIQVSEGIIKILLRLEQNGIRLSERSEIITALTDDDDKPRKEYFFDVDNAEEIKEAVLLTVDKIYNHSLGVASHAHLISNTDKIDPHKEYLSTANSLAMFSILTHRKEKEFLLEFPNGLIAKNDFNWNKLIQKKEQMFFLYEQLNWDIFFKSMIDGKWRDSLSDYLIAFEDFSRHEQKDLEYEIRTGIKAVSKEHMDARKKYQNERKRHLLYSQVVMPNKYLRLTTESLDIQYKALDIETQTQTGHQIGEEHGAEIQKDISTKLSLQPEIAARFGLAEFSKNSILFEDNEYVKARPSEKLKLIELQKYYTQTEKDFNSIMGLIGSFIEATEN